jgi:hypothetical protein
MSVSIEAVLATGQTRVPHIHHSKQDVSQAASEFISFSIVRIWLSQKLLRRRTANNADKVAPPGTELWYSHFVSRVHSLVSQAGSTLPDIIVALLLLSRLRKTLPNDHPLEGTQMKVFTCALILSQKAYSDDRYSNRAWAKMSGFDLTELNTMEREFLTAIQGRLFVNLTEYDRWVKAIQTLGQEHALVLKAASMSEDDYHRFGATVRQDLKEEILLMRKRNSLQVQRSETL